MKLQTLGCMVLWSIGCGSSGPTGGDEPTPLATLDDACGPDGITGNDVLALVETPYQVTFGLDKPSVTSLTVGATYRGGEILCYPPWDPPPGSTAPSRPAHIELEADVSFVTGDGAFNEVLPARLSGSANAPTTFTASIHASEVDGAWVPGTPSPQTVNLEFNGTFTGIETSGSVLWNDAVDNGPVGYWPMNIR